jgi:hypothetical protein
MHAASPSRVQFVVSGKFVAPLLMAAGLFGGDDYWHNQQMETQKRFRTPPYFVNRGPMVIRPCEHCVDLDKLKPQIAGIRFGALDPWDADADLDFAVKRPGRWHDNRHTLIADLAKSGAGDETIQDIAVHVSK